MRLAVVSFRSDDVRNAVPTATRLASDLLSTRQAGRHQLRGAPPTSPSNDQPLVWEMGDNLDSIADATRIVMFQVGQIRRLLLEAAECSLATHAAGVKLYGTRLGHANASLQALSADSECRPGVPHVPGSTLFPGGSLNSLCLLQMHLNGLVHVLVVQVLMSMTSIHARRTVMYRIVVPMLGAVALREGLGPSAFWGS